MLHTVLDPRFRLACAEILADAGHTLWTLYGALAIVMGTRDSAEGRRSSLPVPAR
jgi:hypothetical protein